jgi:predicted ATPase
MKRLIDCRYQLIEVLGKGSMGEVYRAYDLVSDRPVALKMISTALRDDEAISRFVSEFRLLARLHHPNLLRVFNYGVDGEGTPYFTMEVVDARDIVQACQQPCQPLPLVYQIVDGLAYIHARGIVHQDLKPSNILITGEGTPRVVLADFGLARLRSDMKAHEGLVGTVAYMPPELIRGEAVDRRGDLYSLGAVLYEVLAGRPPFQGDTSTIMRLHVEAPPAPIRELNPAVPPYWDRIVGRLLQKNPLRRYGSAWEILSDLIDATGEQVRVAPFYPDFVGRDRELALLRGLLENIKYGRGFFVLIEGEPQGGKTRLLDEFGTYVQLESIPLLALQCREDGGSVIEGLWDEMCRLAQVRGLSLARPSPSGLLTSGHRNTTTHTYSPVEDAAPDETAAYEILTRAAEELASKGAYVLSIDDIHRADPYILRAFEYMARNLYDTGVLICATSSFEGNQSIEHLKTSLTRFSHFLNPRMGRLGKGESSCLIESMLGHSDIPEQVLDQIWVESGGNPLFVSETIRWMVDQGLLRLEKGAWRLVVQDLELDVPQVVETTIRTRLDRLDTDEIDLLEMASVIGNRFSFDLLREIGEWEEESVRRVLGSLIHKRIIVGDQEEGRAVYRFHEPLYARVLRDRIDPQRRERLHRLVGEWLESKYLNGDPELVEELADHFFSGHDPRAYTYCLKAVDSSSERYAYREAILNLERALALVGDAKEKVDLLDRLGRLQLHRGEFMGAVACYREALLIGRTQEIPRYRQAELCRQLAKAYEGEEQYSTALETYQKGLEILGEDGDVREQSRIVLGMSGIYLREGAYGKARELGQMGYELVQDTSNREEIIQATTHLGNLCLKAGERSQAIHYYSQSLSLCREVHDERKSSKVLSNLGLAHSRGGDWKAAQDYFQQAFEHAERVGDVGELLYLCNSLGTSYLQVGSWDDAKAMFEKGLGLARRVDHEGYIKTLTKNLGAGYYLYDHDIEKTAEHYRDYLLYGPLPGDRARAIIMLGVVSYERGDWSDAFHYYREGLMLAKRHDLKGQRARIYSNLAILYDKRGQWNRAARLYDASLAMAQELDNLQMIVGVLTNMGELALRKGDYPAAEVCFQKAETKANELSLSRELIDIYCKQAELQLVMGEPEAALALCTAAQELNEATVDRLAYALLARISGLVCAAQDRWEKIDGCFTQSLDLLRDMGLTYELGRTFYEYGRCKASYGYREAAVAYLEEARVIFQRLGAVPDLEKTTAFLEGGYR